MMTLILHSLQPSRGAVNFILAQLYIGVNIFPFRSVHTSRMNGSRMGFQRSFVGKCPTRKVMVEDFSTFIQAGPQVSIRRVGLSEERLGGHRLMSALNERMIRWTADAA